MLAKLKTSALILESCWTTPTLVLWEDIVSQSRTSQTAPTQYQFMTSVKMGMESMIPLLRLSTWMFTRLLLVGNMVAPSLHPIVPVEHYQIPDSIYSLSWLCYSWESWYYNLYWTYNHVIIATQLLYKSLLFIKFMIIVVHELQQRIFIASLWYAIWHIMWPQIDWEYELGHEMGGRGRRAGHMFMINVWNWG